MDSWRVLLRIMFGEFRPAGCDPNHQVSWAGGIARSSGRVGRRGGKSGVPTGRVFLASIPGAEAPGYYQSSLRDEVFCQHIDQAL